MTDATITTMDPLPRGTMIAIDGEDLLRVVSTTGTGPYTSVVRRVSKWWLLLSRAWYLARTWAARPWRWWLISRCEPDEAGVRCWRKATQGDYCDRHVLTATDWGDDL